MYLSPQTQTAAPVLCAIKTGSSPKEAAAFAAPGCTCSGSLLAVVRPYPRESTSTSQPHARSSLAKAITTGVLPAPPAEIDPTLTTGHCSVFGVPRSRSFIASSALYSGASGNAHGLRAL